MATVNADLDALHATLVDAHDRLHTLIGQTTDPKVAQAIVTEMQEITHRIDLVQSVLFAKTTADITADVGAVQTAAGQLDASLAGINSATDLVKTCTTFLTVVDEAIDLAKVAMA